MILGTKTPPGAVTTILNEAFPHQLEHKKYYYHLPSDAQPLPVQPLNYADVQIFRHTDIQA